MISKRGRPPNSEKLVSMTVKVTQHQKNFLNRHGNMSAETQRITQKIMDESFTSAQWCFIDSFPGDTFFDKLQALVDVAIVEDKGINHD